MTSYHQEKETKFWNHCEGQAVVAGVKVQTTKLIRSLSLAS